MTKELVTTQQGAVATTGGPRGFESVNLQKVSLPRVKLMQSNSPELEDDDLGLRAGQFVHSLLLETVPEKFVPIRFWDSNIYFAPREEGGGIVCRSSDGKTSENGTACASCPHGQWNDDNPPACTATINALILLEGFSLPVVLSFANTSYKFGRKFRDMALYSAMEKGQDAWEKRYKLAGIKTNNAKGSFYTCQVKPGGLPDDAQKARAEELYRQFANTVIETEVDDMAQEETAVSNDF